MVNNVAFIGIYGDHLTTKNTMNKTMNDNNPYSYEVHTVQIRENMSD